MARRGQAPQASVERAGLGEPGGRVGIEATRDYDHAKTGYMRAGQRTSIDVETAKQIVEDNRAHGENAPFKLVEYTDEEKEAIEGSKEDKSMESPENRSVESDEKK